MPKGSGNKLSREQQHAFLPLTSPLLESFGELSSWQYCLLPFTSKGFAAAPGPGFLMSLQLLARKTAYLIAFGVKPFHYFLMTFTSVVRISTSFLKLISAKCNFYILINFQ